MKTTAANLTPYLDKTFHCNALDLLLRLPSQSIDSVITDPMYGVAVKPSRSNTYDWGVDPFGGDPNKWWAYHQPIYEQCRRVLRPGGKLAWAMGSNFYNYFATWFGGYRVWSFTRWYVKGIKAFGHIWLVQTQEGTPIPFPDADSLLIFPPREAWRGGHPCPKRPEEMEFMVEHLTEPDQIILDCFAGIGTTLQAAQKLRRRFIGCDLSQKYCRLAKWSLDYRK